MNGGMLPFADPMAVDEPTEGEVFKRILTSLNMLIVKPLKEGLTISIRHIGGSRIAANRPHEFGIAITIQVNVPLAADFANLEGQAVGTMPHAVELGFAAGRFEIEIESERRLDIVTPTRISYNPPAPNTKYIVITVPWANDQDAELAGL